MKKKTQRTDRHKRTGKTYSFDNKHNKNKPAMIWFQESDEGLILFVVFYTQACRWSLCTGCNLPMLSSRHHIDFISLINQIDNLFKDPRVQKKRNRITKIIVSNNGSVLDEETFSSTALLYLIARQNMYLKRLKVMSLETRTEYVDLAELEFLSRALAEGKNSTSLEIAVGFEAFDEKIRNKNFCKGLSLNEFENLVHNMIPYGFHLKTYFMFKPVPGLSDSAAISDIHHATDYLSTIAKKTKLKINMHINPTYVARDTLLEKAFFEGRYTPPTLVHLAKAALRGKKSGVTVFLGLSDEGLAVPGGSFIRKGDQAIIKKLEQFNRTQDFGILEKVALL
ncbi:MAG: hypothetical protein HQM16_08015 [Deltaproteobacteria bacterium]|nr:hypothetical protein [Deltaproteobacteria bacterium]